MSCIKRKMKKRAETWQAEKQQLPETKRAMKYRCEKCGKEWWMWLQTGLEEHGENHKPVPYAIGCKCGGIATHVDWNEDQYLFEPIPITKSMNYFANQPDRDCGVAVIR